ncbi:YidC/Oxa1 family membrane protein insertase [Streptomyces pseudovenezuelae]|uniref:Membrane protein insertase YidC n=1 Tax=Streptomyces pseudovenezuelae TaxID=67350 RepID=A0ABT6LJZ1_9ACTN|nr:membrane protein insertase YidC [Streptomyces pseudovenezuelae]MDH6215981.1 YidC/Oxa1 family membrane protein insertase [Streptomyces pseudovenezuelae]
MSVFSAFASLVEQLADLLQPLFGATAVAAAIVLFTALVRLLVHPLSRAAARGQQAQARLRPQVAELRKRYAKQPEKLQQAVLELHAEEKVSPLSGCLPSLLQLPAFFLLYRLFSSEGDALLSHRLFAAPLGGRWADALAEGGVFGAAGLVYVGLFLVAAVVAAFTCVRTRRMAADGSAVESAVGKAMPYLSFFTLFTVAVVPLAAALYVVTSATWSAVERVVLYR